MSAVRRSLLVAALLVVPPALVVPAAQASPAPAPASWTGIEYYKGHPTDFLQLRFSVSGDGRWLQQMDGTVHAECTVAGGNENPQDFNLDYPGRRRIAAGRFSARYDDVTHPKGATAHRRLTITGRFSGRRASGTLDFQSYIENSGPGCSYHAEWRATRKR